MEAPSDATPGSPVELDDDTINGGTDAVQTSVPTTIHRVTLEGQRGCSPTARRSRSTTRWSRPRISSLALSTPESIDALNDTMVADPPATQGVKASSYHVRPPRSKSSTRSCRVPTSFDTQTRANAPRRSWPTTDGYDGSSSARGHPRCAARGLSRLRQPRWRRLPPSAGSALIDVSPTKTWAPPSTTDRDGNPRVVTIDHPATPVDLGAYEYQPPAPAGGTPGSGGGNPGTGGGTPVSAPTARDRVAGHGHAANGSRPSPPSHRTLTVKLTPLGHATVTGRRLSLRLSAAPPPARRSS